MINMRYWTSKYDKPLRTDASDISKAFLYSKVDNNIDGYFNDDERLILAKLLLQGFYVPKENEQLACVRIESAYNGEIATDALIILRMDGSLSLYRYDYSTFALAIPLAWSVAAVKDIYTRLGFELDDSARLVKDTESYGIVHDSSLYGYALANLAAEGKDSVAVAYIDRHKNGVNSKERWKYMLSSFTNYWLFFRKLYCEGVNFFEFMAHVGTSMPSFASISFLPRTEHIIGYLEEVKRVSRGRDYGTYVEEVLVERVTRGEDLTPAKN